LEDGLMRQFVATSEYNRLVGYLVTVSQTKPVPGAGRINLDKKSYERVVRSRSTCTVWVGSGGGFEVTWLDEGK
jgi:hypothetical protein